MKISTGIISLRLVHLSGKHVECIKSNLTLIEQFRFPACLSRFTSFSSTKNEQGNVLNSR